MNMFLQLSCLVPLIFFFSCLHIFWERFNHNKQTLTAWNLLTYKVYTSQKFNHSVKHLKWPTFLFCTWLTLFSPLDVECHQSSWQMNNIDYVYMRSIIGLRSIFWNVRKSLFPCVSNQRYSCIQGKCNQLGSPDQNSHAWRTSWHNAESSPPRLPVSKTAAARRIMNNSGAGSGPLRLRFWCWYWSTTSTWHYSRSSLMDGKNVKEWEMESGFAAHIHATCFHQSPPETLDEGAQSKSSSCH